MTDLESGRRIVNQAARELLDRVDVSLDELLAAQEPRGGDLRHARGRVPVSSGEELILEVRSLQVSDDPTRMVSFLGLDGSGSVLPLHTEAMLTRRERDVARLVVRGLGDAEIAGRLVISRHTVNQHLKSIYRKLGVEGRVDLAIRAHVGWIPESREAQRCRTSGISAGKVHD